MVDYLYDGTFAGLLTCIYHHYYTEKASGIFPEGEYQPTFLGGFWEVATEEEKAVRVYEAIEKKISSYDLRRIYKVFCSDTERKECRILDYIRLGFVKGSCVSMLHGDPIVFPIQAAEKKVNNEVHRMKGLVRFSQLDGGVLYSPVTPDHDILEFLAEHFCDRFQNDPFVIHDVRRSKALVAYKKQWHIRFFVRENLPELSEKERDYRKLWKQYFETMEIRERRNPKCQRRCMPKRYWENLTEFQME